MFVIFHVMRHFLCLSGGTTTKELEHGLGDLEKFSEGDHGPSRRVIKGNHERSYSKCNSDGILGQFRGCLLFVP